MSPDGTAGIQGPALNRAEPLQEHPGVGEHRVKKSRQRLVQIGKKSTADELLQLLLSVGLETQV